MGITKEELKRLLRNFIGTEKYYRINSKTLLTDGTNFLSEVAGCYWLMSFYSLKLQTIDVEKEQFTTLKMNKNGVGGLLEITDGNDKVFLKQHIEYTDFILESIVLYAVWDTKFWVIMLQSEY